MLHLNPVSESFWASGSGTKAASSRLVSAIKLRISRSPVSSHPQFAGEQPFALVAELSLPPNDTSHPQFAGAQLFALLHTVIGDWRGWLSGQTAAVLLIWLTIRKNWSRSVSVKMASGPVGAMPVKGDS